MLPPKTKDGIELIDGVVLFETYHGRVEVQGVTKDREILIRCRNGTEWKVPYWQLSGEETYRKELKVTVYRDVAHRKAAVKHAHDQLRKAQLELLNSERRLVKFNKRFFGPIDELLKLCLPHIYK